MCTWLDLGIGGIDPLQIRCMESWDIKTTVIIYGISPSIARGASKVGYVGFDRTLKLLA